MSVGTMRSPASANLLDTHRRLAQAVGGTFHPVRGFTLCTGTLAHTICNYACSLDLDARSVERLAALAAERRAFQVVSMPGDQPEDVEALLSGAGFVRRGVLTQMEGLGSEGGASIQLQMAGSRAERVAIASFMTEQFYGSHARSFTRPIAAATVASDLPLLAAWEGSRPSAAVMLNEGEGILGVYNLCVASKSRHRGVGTDIIGWCKRFAWERGLSLTLQCDGALVEWYRTVGLRPVGSVAGFGLDTVRQSTLDTFD